MAERARLLIECVGNCTEGSNPSRSDDYYVLSRFGLIGLSIFVQLIMFCFCNLLYFSSCVLLLLSSLRLRSIFDQGMVRSTQDQRFVLLF